MAAGWWPPEEQLNGPTILVLDRPAQVRQPTTYCNTVLVYVNDVHSTTAQALNLLPDLIDLSDFAPGLKWSVAHEELGRLVRASRVPRPAPPQLEARHGFTQAPRLPCYRGTRTR